jgi:UDP-N-acetylglucosamine:LPS N-acetylglucosamine transferase
VSPPPPSALAAPAPPRVGPARSLASRGRIVVFSASMGAGHDGAADELGRRLGADGFAVERRDFLDLLPGRLGTLLAGGYHQLLTSAPGGYQRIYSVTERSRPGPAVRTLLRSAEARMLRAIPADTAAVVSTYPGASQVLGTLRRRGLLTVPVVTYLTDFSVHGLWVAPGVDAHLAAHLVPAAQATAQGAAGVRTCGPVVGTRFRPPTAGQRQAARLRFGLDGQMPLALLVAGSWGVGDVAQAAADLRECGIAEPVVVCGRNEALAERLRREGVRHVHGWVDDMPGLMHACDVLVQNAGGLTSLEAFATGLPVASYRCIPGHGQTNAAALEEAGLAVWIRERDGLRAALAELLDGPLGREQRRLGLRLFSAEHGPADAIAALADGAAPHRGIVRGRTGRRTRLPAMAVIAALTVLLGVGAPLAEAYSRSPAAFPVLGHYLKAGRP